jgi:hypothetical protein
MTSSCLSVYIRLFLYGVLVISKQQETGCVRKSFLPGSLNCFWPSAAKSLSLWNASTCSCQSFHNCNGFQVFFSYSGLKHDRVWAWAWAWHGRTWWWPLDTAQHQLNANACTVKNAVLWRGRTRWWPLDTAQHQLTANACTVKNAVLWDIKPQFVLHRRYITSPLQFPAG